MTGRNRVFTDEFKAEAVRLSLESGLSVEQVAQDLGIGKSTLIAWRRRHRESDLGVAPPEEDPAKEIARLRRENEILRQERDLLKKATAFFAQETKR